MTGAWTLDVDADRIAWLTCDMPGSSTNVLSAAVIGDLAAALTQVVAHKPVGLVVCSAKRSGFIAGADIKEFVDIRTPEEGYALVRAGQTVFDELDALPFPSVAAIHGFALGGGLELALAPTAWVPMMRSSPWDCPRSCSVFIRASAARCGASGCSAYGRPST
jgi:3-hydroxyacyl-CoA dehydrogenase/enoyl-CoA hydratase/3-hydroxybutyryl-CoA epimerase